MKQKSLKIIAWFLCSFCDLYDILNLFGVLILFFFKHTCKIVTYQFLNEIEYNKKIQRKI